MLNLVLFLTFCAVTLRTARAVRRERAIYAEFGQTTALMLLVLPFPLAWPLAWFAGLALPHFFAWAFAALCFLPALLLGRRQMQVFERCGTSRAQGAEEAAAGAVGFATLGVAILGVRIAWTVLLAFRAGA
jgi:uncharacterized membrane protein